MSATISGNVQFASGVSAAGLGFEVVAESTPAVVDSVLVLSQPGRRYVLDADGDLPSGFTLEEGTYTLLFDNEEEVEIVVGSAASYGLDELIAAQASGDGATRFYGSGSPEGSVVGQPGFTYWDRTNQELYIKDTGTGTTGWRRFG